MPSVNVVAMHLTDRRKRTVHSRHDIPQMDGNSERASYGSKCRTFRPQQNAEWCTDDLGCVLGSNLYIAPGSRDKNDCAAADDDDISIASCNTHT